MSSASVKVVDAGPFEVCFGDHMAVSVAGDRDDVMARGLSSAASGPPADPDMRAARASRNRFPAGSFVIAAGTAAAP